MLKTYDVLLVLSSSMSEDAVKKALERVSDEIARAGGSVDAPRVLGKRAFARPLKKRQEGLYVRMGLSMEPAQVETLRARFRLNEDIFRSQIVSVALRAEEKPKTEEEEAKQAAQPEPEEEKSNG